MASLITTSATWTGKQNLDYFLKPLFIGKSPLATQGIRIIPNVQSTMKLNYFGAVSKVTKAYAKGFSAASGSTMTQRDLTVYRLKSEFSQDAMEFNQTVFEQALNKGIDWNNITGTQLENIIIEIFRNAMGSDWFRIFWLGDVYKETVSGTPYKYTGSADTNYNMFNGMWKTLIDNSATSPSETQIKRVAITNGSVAQVETVTLTGTSGTANIAVNGVNYLATFSGSLTTTATNFVTSHATALALRGITVTSSTVDVILTSSIAGQPFTAPTITNASGYLAGTVAHTTANTAPAALSTDEAVSTFRSMYEGSRKVLKEKIPMGKVVLLVTDTMYENYMETLESDGTEQSHRKLIEGQEYLVYRGIPVMTLGWDYHLDSDFPTAYPHRAIMTTTDNLVMGIDATSEFNKTEFWYNKDEQENRFRNQLKMGANYVHPDYTTIAY